MFEQMMIVMTAMAKSEQRFVINKLNMLIQCLVNGEWRLRMESLNKIPAHCKCFIFFGSLLIRLCNSIANWNFTDECHWRKKLFLFFSLSR